MYDVYRKSVSFAGGKMKNFFREIAWNRSAIKAETIIFKNKAASCFICRTNQYRRIEYISQYGEKSKIRSHSLVKRKWLLAFSSSGCCTIPIFIIIQILMLALLHFHLQYLF